MDSNLTTCPVCRGSRRQAVVCEINGVVDATLTRPCRTCLGAGLVWITSAGMEPWGVRRSWAAR